MNRLILIQSGRYVKRMLNFIINGKIKWQNLRKTAYVCSDWHAEFARWQGQCSACKAWNTISEVRLVSATKGKNDRFSGYAGETHAKIQCLSEISLQELPRFSSGFNELIAFGMWIVPGSAILIGGHPGAEKYLVVASNVRISATFDRTLCQPEKNHCNKLPCVLIA